MESREPRPRALIPIGAFYFGYYAAVGILLPFFPQHLRALGLTGSQLGLVSAASPVMTLLSPPLWGFLADRTRRAALLLTLASGGYLLAMVPLLFASGLAGILPVVMLTGLFSSALPMLADSLTLQHLGARSGGYARVRLFGSLGFIASTTLFGFLWSGGAGFPPPVVVGMLVGALLAFAASLGVRGSGEVYPIPSLKDAASLLADRRISLLIASTALHWLSCAPYHLLFAVHVAELGMRPSIAGLGMGVGVAAEVGIMLVFPRVLEVLSPPRILALAYVASSVRWLLVGLVDSPIALVLLQVIHGLTFGAFLLASVTWLGQVVPARLRATGQALFTAATYGIGGILGYLLAGRLYEAWGARQVFFAGAALEWVPLGLVLLLASRPTPIAREAVLGSREP